MNNTTGGAAGGPLASEDMTRINQQHMKPMYPTVSENLAARRADLPELIRLVAEHMLATATDLTPTERQLLYDLTGKKSGRYRFKVLERLMEIAPRAQNPHLLSEQFRRAVLVQLPRERVLCPVDTFLTETRAQAQADVAQALFLTERTQTRRDAALEKLSQHEWAIRGALDALHVWPARRS